MSSHSLKIDRLFSFECILFTLFWLCPPHTISQTCTATQKCTTTACCSSFGSCGFGPPFCGPGCQHDCNATSECGQFSAKPPGPCPLQVCCSKFGFCGTTAEFCGDGCQSGCQDPPHAACGSDTKRLLKLGYYASWASTRKCTAVPISAIDPRQYTHLNYAFGVVQGGSVVVPGDGTKESQDYTDFAGLKNINPGLKVILSVGGWAFNDPGPTREEFHNIALTPGSRTAFANYVLNFLNKFNFDGIDIDWEYPGADDRGGSPEDTDNYVALVQAIRDVIGGDRIITIAAPASYWYLRHFKVGLMSKPLSWINVMTYDFHGVWDANSTVLGAFVRPHTNMVEITSAIDLFKRDGVPPEKLMLGLGYYGRGFTLSDPNCRKIGCPFSGPSLAGECTDAPGTYAWFEINKLLSQKAVEPITDEPSQTKILTFDNQWIGYDDLGTLQFKTEWAATSCLKGVMIWSIDQGVDFVEKDTPLAFYGSMTHAEFTIKMHSYGEGRAPAWVISSTRDSLSGYDTYSMIADELARFSDSVLGPGATGRSSSPGGSSLCSSRGSSLGGLLIAHRIIMRLFEEQARQQTAAGPSTPAIGDLNQFNPGDPDNPIQTVFRRLIGFTNPTNRPPNGPVYRTEALSAEIWPRHVGDARTDFSGRWMYDWLQAIEGFDDRGHILGSQFGGVAGSGAPTAYNLAPQNWVLNQQRFGPGDWVDMENTVGQHFRDNTGGQTHVVYVVSLSYDENDPTAGRPVTWTWAHRLIRADGTEIEMTGSAPNRDPSGRDTPRPPGR